MAGAAGVVLALVAPPPLEDILDVLEGATTGVLELETTTGALLLGVIDTLDDGAEVVADDDVVSGGSGTEITTELMVAEPALVRGVLDGERGLLVV